MKLTRVLLFAAAGVAAGLLLARTEKGKELRKNLSDKAGDWADKLRNLKSDSQEYIEDVMDDASKIAKKAKSKADGQLA